MGGGGFRSCPFGLIVLIFPYFFVTPLYGCRGRYACPSPLRDPRYATRWGPEVDVVCLAASQYRLPRCLLVSSASLPVDIVCLAASRYRMPQCRSISYTKRTLQIGLPPIDVVLKSRRVSCMMFSRNMLKRS